MTEYVLTAFGAAVSFGLFLIGYRKTIGAKQERIAAANSHLERILIRRVVLEGDSPNESDVSRLIEGKTRDYRISATEVLSVAQLLNSVYTRIVESDLIQADQREEVIGRITPVLAQLDEQPIREYELEELNASRRRRRNTQLYTFVMAITFSALGSVFVAIVENPTDLASLLELVPILTTTAGLGFGSILALYAALRLRASQERTSDRARYLSDYVALERRVGTALERLDGVRGASRSDGFDYVVEESGRKSVIEIKAWTRPVPSNVVSSVARRLKTSAEKAGAVEAIIVSPTRTSRMEAIASAEQIRIMTPNEVRRHLASLRKSS